MPSLRYLNTILTVITILLTLHLWTLWTVPSAGGIDQVALDLAHPAYAIGIPNAGAQRKQNNDLLKQLVHKTEELTGLFKSGRARVRLEQAPQKPSS